VVSAQGKRELELAKLVQAQYQEEYMKGRGELAQEYECTQEYSPAVFESFELYMGIPGSLIDRHRKVGSIKGFLLYSTHTVLILCS
jgi:hypothetical protein